MKRTMLTAVAALLLLTGCAGAPAAEPTQEAEETKPAGYLNGTACSDFSIAAKDLIEATKNGRGDMTMREFDQSLEDHREALDQATLIADGTIRDRMEAVMDDLPPVGNLSEVAYYGLYESAKDFVTNIGRVETACEADNHTFPYSFS